MPYVVFTKTVDSFISDFYGFCDDHPEYEDTRYGEILESTFIKYDSDFMKTANISNMDVKTVIALLMGQYTQTDFVRGTVKLFEKADTSDAGGSIYYKSTKSNN